MKVSVDYDVCASTGACMQVCPEVFEVRKDGYLYVLQENPDEAVHDKDFSIRIRRFEPISTDSVTEAPPR